jgi:hypothetical protein
MITNSSNFLSKIEFMKVVNVDELLHNQNGMTKNSYEVNLILITVFSTSSFAMQFFC